MKTKRKAGFTLVEIMIVVAIIGLLAGIAIPNLMQSITSARQRACAMNRLNIDGAKMRWSVEQNQPPTAVPKDEDLFGTDRYIEHKPNCPAGGGYVLNPVAEKCTCNAPKHGN